MFKSILKMFDKTTPSTKEVISSKIDEYNKGRELAIRLKDKNQITNDELNLIVKNQNENNKSWILGFTSYNAKTTNYKVEYLNEMPFDCGEVVSPSFSVEKEMIIPSLYLR